MSFNQEEFLLGEWTVNPLHNTIAKAETITKIEKRLMKVLILLANNPEKGLSKEQLLSAIWQDKIVSDEALSVAISQLRKALGCNAKSPLYIKTITGFGYTLLQPAILIDSQKEQSDSHVTSKLGKASLYFSGLAIVVIVIISIAWIKNPVAIDEEELIENETYAKAIYLMQQTVEEVQQAEVLLTNLNNKIPKNPVILNALGKSLLFQINHLEPNQKALVTHKAKTYFTEAIALDGEFADVYLQLALIAFYHDNELQLAEEYFIQSIALDPSQAITHAVYSYLLLTQQRNEEAIRLSKVAQSIDPTHYPSPAIQWAYYMAGEYELSKKELAKLYSIDPDSEIYHSAALNLYEALGEEQRAFEYYLKKFELVGYSQQEIIEATEAFNNGGLKSLSSWLANVKNEQQDVGQYLPPFSTARYFVTAGEYEKAIEFLELAVNNKELNRVWLNADPKYTPLKQFPRFNKLLKQIGF